MQKCRAFVETKIVFGREDILLIKTKIMTEVPGGKTPPFYKGEFHMVQTKSMLEIKFMKNKYLLMLIIV